MPFVPESRKHLIYRSALAKEFPMVGAEEGSQAMIEEDAGLVYADKCVKMLQVKILYKNESKFSSFLTFKTQERYFSGCIFLVEPSIPNHLTKM